MAAMTPLQIRSLVDSAQLRTASRTEAYQVLSDEIDRLDLDRATELAVRLQAYGYLFPEYALAPGDR